MSTHNTADMSLTRDFISANPNPSSSFVVSSSSTFNSRYTKSPKTKIPSFSTLHRFFPNDVSSSSYSIANLLKEDTAIKYSSRLATTLEKTKKRHLDQVKREKISRELEWIRQDNFMLNGAPTRLLSGEIIAQENEIQERKQGPCIFLDKKYLLKFDDKCFKPSSISIKNENKEYGICLEKKSLDMWRFSITRKFKVSSLKSKDNKAGKFFFQIKDDKECYRSKEEFLIFGSSVLYKSDSKFRLPNNEKYTQITLRPNVKSQKNDSEFLESPMINPIELTEIISQENSDDLKTFYEVSKFDRT